MVIILIGVSGSGKTTIGKLLTKKLNWKFIEGDDFHSKKNKEKMENGIPLTSADRKPWLLSLKKIITKSLEKNENIIIACSALKKAYRKILKINRKVKFVYLKGDFKIIKERIENRKNHFFKVALLESQFNDLEEPKNILNIDIKNDPEFITNKIIKELNLNSH